MLWSGILLVAVLVGVMVVAVVRRRLTGRSSVPPQGFTLHELRELHELGRISDIEFERAKAAIIARARAPAAGAEDDPAEQAVRELKERRRAALDRPADKLVGPAGGEDSQRAPGETRDEPDKTV